MSSGLTLSQSPACCPAPLSQVRLPAAPLHCESRAPPAPTAGQPHRESSCKQALALLPVPPMRFGAQVPSPNACHSAVLLACCWHCHPKHSLALRAAALAGAICLGLARQRGGEPREAPRNGKLSRYALGLAHVPHQKYCPHSIAAAAMCSNVLQPVVKSSLPPLPARSACHVAAQRILPRSVPEPHHAPPASLCTPRTCSATHALPLRRQLRSSPTF